MTVLGRGLVFQPVLVTQTTVLPSNIPPESLPDKFSELFVGKIEQIRNSLHSDRPVPTEHFVFSGTLFAEFQPITDERVKAVLREMPKTSCDLDPILVPILHDCLEEITPIVVDIINKSLSSDVVPSSFKHALVRTLLKKSKLDPNCLRNYRPISNLPFLSKVLECIVLKQFFAALGISQPSGTLPVSLPKMS